MTRSIILMAILAIVESLQILIIVVLIFSFVPIPLTDFAKDLFPFVRNDDLRPNRRMFFLHVWVAAGLLIHGAGLWLFKGRLGEAQTDSLLRRLIMVDGAWLLLQLFFIFKMILYPQVFWAKPLFYASLGLSLLSRVFWIEINAFLLKTDEILPVLSSQRRLRLGLDAMILLFLFSSLWIFDLSRLWAVIDLAGSRAFAEITWRDLSPLIKGIDYQSAIPWIMTLSCVYFAFFYLLLRCLFGSVLLAGCGLLLAVKWQYFHAGIIPDIWQFPLKTVIPLLPDVFCLLFLLMHARQKKTWALWAAGVIAGAYLAYHFQTGIWLWGAWIGYLVLAKVKPAWYFLPLILCLLFWSIAHGIHGAGAIIYQEYLSTVHVLQGQASLPYYFCLRGRNFFAFSVQFLIPLIYFVTIVSIKAKEDKLLMIPVSIYGLGLFTVHVWQPSLSNYYSVCTPLVIMLCFWASRVLGLISPGRRIIISSLFLMIYAAALLTNNAFGVYPNLWNMSGVNWTAFKAIDQQQGIRLKRGG